ncbi:MAG: RHS repeat-associated core domain-containing protein, partial [Acidobacteria bacterium]|nr:RHS repeat-associated core domain-containing protein [Acidobacteriota bacterium]
SSENIRQQFTGYEKDDDSGLDFAQARHMASSLGRFMQPDPLGASGRPHNPQTWNRYAYVLNRPINRIDPSGLLDLSGLKGFAKGIAKGAKKLVVGTYELGKGIIKNPRATTTAIAHGVIQQGKDAISTAKQISADPIAFSDTVIDSIFTSEPEILFEVFGEATFDVGLIIATAGGGAEVEGAANVGKIASEASSIAKQTLSTAEQAANGIAKSEGEILSRLGTSYESATRLGKKAAEAEEFINYHGVSVTAGTPIGPASSASREAVEQFFKVVNTPTRNDPLHRTVVLSKPVTKDVADTFNKVFGRQK